MTSRVPFYISILALIVFGLYLTIFRHITYGVPWTPGEAKQVWQVEARIEFYALGDPVKISLAAPETQDGFTLLSESASSPGYGVSYVPTNNSRRVEWSKRRGEGAQIIYYKTEFLVDPYASPETVAPQTAVQAPLFDDPEIIAAQSLIQLAEERSADDETFTRELIKALNNPHSQSAQLLLDTQAKVEVIEQLLSFSGIPNKIIGVLLLEDGRRRQTLEPMNQVWNGSRWVVFDPRMQTQDQQAPRLIWDKSDISLLDVIGGKHSRVLFSMIRQEVSANQATSGKVNADNLLNLSIHSLPLEEQAMFKTIMLIPIGALIVVFLRVIVGLKTSGTFMPVLIAVAFVQTQLLPGIIGFLLIVGTGLIIRSYLSRLNLLLVARISAVIIVVILIIALFTVLAFKLGITQGLTITFFPMIILSWTIERMSILWEEEGAKEVILQGGGSLLTSVLVYLAMTNGYIQHLTFNFIGLQLIILALILILGTYTGYRLSELRRFNALAEDE